MTITAKVMLLGDIGVGKSSLAKRLLFDRFDTDYKTTIGVDIMTCDLKLGPACDNAPMRLVLWDTDGDFGQHIFKSAYVTGASAAVIVCDAARNTSIESVTRLVNGFTERLPGRAFRAIVNKTDLVEPEHLTRSIEGIPPDHIMFSSAKTGEGVRAVFEAIGEAIWRQTR
jgi:Ras-related protein Rab-5C